MQKPNIIIIHADQLRCDCIGPYGNKEVMTPNLDKLAGEGVTYFNHFTSFPVCTPSRYSLLSGLPVFKHRGWTNHSTPCPGTPFFPETLRDAGYKTKAVGKMHFTPTYLDVGFQEMTLCEQAGNGRWDDDYHRELMKEGLIDYQDLEDQRKEFRTNARAEYWKKLGADPHPLPEEYQSTHWIGRHSLESLDDPGNPFLLMTGFVKPHHPFDPSERWIKMYENRDLTILPGWSEEVPGRDYDKRPGFFDYKSINRNNLKRVMTHYYASISEIDEWVGRILSRLEKLGIYDDTMILFTSDHGEYLGYHHLLLKGNNMYDPLMKIPLIIKYPGSRNAGSREERLSSNTQLAAHILRQAGLSRHEKMDSHELNTGKEEDIVFAHAYAGREIFIRTKQYKLILNHEDESKSLFFDLEKDPYEFENRVTDPGYTSIINKLKKKAADWEEGLIMGESYLAENAPIIDTRNARKGTAEERKPVIRYYTESMEKLGFPAGEEK
jgi:arylsulfatase